MTYSCAAQILAFLPLWSGTDTLLIHVVDVLVDSSIVPGWGDMTWAAALCVGDQAVSRTLAFEEVTANSQCAVLLSGSPDSDRQMSSLLRQT